MNIPKNTTRAQDSNSAPQQPAKSKPFSEEKKSEHGKTAEDSTSSPDQTTAKPVFKEKTETMKSVRETAEKLGLQQRPDESDSKFEFRTMVAVRKKNARRRAAEQG